MQADAGETTSDAMQADAGEKASDAMPASDAGFDPATACLGQGDIVVVAGDDFVYSGPPLVVQGGTDAGLQWYVQAISYPGGLPFQISIFINAYPRPDGLWMLAFSTGGLGGALVPGTFTPVERTGLTGPGYAGLDINAYSRGCNTVSGAFQVLEMKSPVWWEDSGADPVVSSFTAVFEQHCGGGPTKIVGCVHVEQ
jgi:hypothetical protein